MTIASSSCAVILLKLGGLEFSRNLNENGDPRLAFVRSCRMTRAGHLCASGLPASQGALVANAPSHPITPRLRTLMATAGSRTCGTVPQHPVPLGQVAAGNPRKPASRVHSRTTRPTSLPHVAPLSESLHGTRQRRADDGCSMTRRPGR